MQIIDRLHFTPNRKQEMKANPRYFGAPQVSGVIVAELNDRQAGMMRDALRTENADSEYALPVFTGKSGSAHGGLHVYPHWIDARLKNKVFEVPADVISLLPEDWLTAFLLAVNGKRATGPLVQTAMHSRLQIGRILCYRKEEMLTEQELRDAIDSKDIRLGAMAEVQNLRGIGVVSAGIDPSLRLVLHRSSMTLQRMCDVIRHGRNASHVMQYLQQSTSNAIPTGGLFTGVTEFSSIRHPFLVRPDLSPQSVDFLSAPYYDASRSTGIGPTVHGKRPVAMFNVEAKPINATDVRVPFVVFKPQDVSKISMPVYSETAKDRIHEDGLKCTDVLPADPESLRPWFAGITPHPRSGGQAAVIVSRNGVTPVSWAPEYGLHKTDIGDAVMGGERIRDPNFLAVQNAIPLTNATGRVFFGHHLPSSSHLESLSRAGVKVFYFRTMPIPDKAMFEGKPDPRPFNNHYMTTTVHKKLMELECRGCQFIWWPQSPNGDEAPREFYKGVFVLPNAKDRYDRFRKGGTGIAMFGSAVPGLEDAVRPDVYQFGEGLAQDLRGYGEVGILEGGGPSLMQLAREMAERQNFINISFGVDFEKAEEVPNFNSDAVVHFASGEIEYRQTLFEMMQLIPVFNIGGKGTWYELVLSFLKQGLKQFLPTPLVLVNKEKFWQGTIDQIAEMTDQQRHKKPLTSPWQRYMVNPVETYEQARQIIANFVRDPQKVWQEAGITPDHISQSLVAHTATAESMHLEIPPYLLEACKKYGA